MTTRSSWDDYFMGIAREVSTRATCGRKFVGAVIVRDKSILATGYNGNVRGLPHCDDVGHLMEDSHCVPGDVVVSKLLRRHDHIAMWLASYKAAGGNDWQ